jgi:hypothetical protein
VSVGRDTFHCRYREIAKNKREKKINNKRDKRREREKTRRKGKEK